ncbi:uncharacterized protein LOC117928913 isoform X2 [Vitis riparia]|uniref:uncharacterized protein LOC117928913 isoform X2 n=1 Tax=Vitis riparia TaxID=96939 RepID=UPI00155B2D77|nr:uncharacterized protein LOC117928913 isoform X2 [Vitis riparia]
MGFNSSTPEMNLKLLINTEDNKVVFAEAEKDFIDFLFNLLTLPIGTIVGFLPEACLGGLHKSVKKLEGAYLQPNQSSDSPLKLNTPAYAILPFFNPSSSGSNDHFCHCSSSRSCGHVQGLVTYMVTDDLLITPMSLTATMALFKKCNIEEVNVLEEKVVKIGFDEALQLLKCSLQSNAALTGVFLEKEETQQSKAAPAVAAVAEVAARPAVAEVAARPAPPAVTIKSRSSR